MKRRAKKTPGLRRNPAQQRSQATVDAVLDATVKLLKRGGAGAITTNSIAVTAGVSIGSLYQYFANKNAVFVALHQRHIDQVDGLMRRIAGDCTESSLECLIQALIDGMVATHAADPELSILLQSDVPHRAGGKPGFAARLHSVFRDALAPHAGHFGRKIDLNTRTFVVANLLESLGHASVLHRPRRISLEQAKRESSNAILAYLAA